MSDPRAEGTTARQRFVHALLERELGDARARDRRRTEAALAALRAEATASRGRILRSNRWSRLAAAAAVVVAVASLFLLGPGAPNASATLESALEHALLPLDRTYLLRVDPLRPRLGEREVRLHVRGNERIAIEQVRGRMAGLWVGFDGTESWIVPPLERFPVLVGDERARLAQWLAERDADLPFLQLTTILERLRDYELEETRAAGRILLRGRRPVGVEGPELVELTLDEATGNVVGVDLQTGRGALRRSLHFTLVDEAPKPDGFYGHAAHHAPGRAIRRR